MHFDKTEDLRHRLVFWCSLIMSAALTIYLLSEGSRYDSTPGATLGSFWTSGTFIVIGVVIMGLWAMAYLMHETRFADHYRAKKLIDQMIDVFEVYDIGVEPREFSCSEHINVSICVRDGAYAITISRWGTQCELLVQRYRIDDGHEAGTLLPLCDLGFVRTLTQLLRDQLGLTSAADGVSELFRGPDYWSEMHAASTHELGEDIRSQPRAYDHAASEAYDQVADEKSRV